MQLGYLYRITYKSKKIANEIKQREIIFEIFKNSINLRSRRSHSLRRCSRRRQYISYLSRTSALFIAQRKEVCSLGAGRMNYLRGSHSLREISKFRPLCCFDHLPRRPWREKKFL